MIVSYESEYNISTGITDDQTLANCDKIFFIYWLINCILKMYTVNTKYIDTFINSVADNKYRELQSIIADICQWDLEYLNKGVIRSPTV